MVYVCYTMIEQRAQLLQDVIDKKRKLNDLVSILNVSRQTLSKWKSLYAYWWVDALLPKKPWPRIGSDVVNRTPAPTEELVCLVARKNFELWPDLLSELLEEIHDIQLHPTTVWRILKRNGIRYHAWYRKLKQKRKLYTMDTPGRELQLDVSYPWWRQKECRIYSAIDDCSRFVFSQSLLNHTQEATISFLERLIIKAPFRIQAIRTDQWSEFSSKVTTFLESYWIKHIKNPPYMPQHNGKIERFHRTYKSQARIRWNFSWNNEELNYHLQLYLHYYNYKKKHRWLWMNGTTPAQKLRDCWIII